MSNLVLSQIFTVGDRFLNIPDSLPKSASANMGCFYLQEEVVVLQIILLFALFATISSTTIGAFHLLPPILFLCYN